MTFPQTVLPITVELLLDGTWTDITDPNYVQRRDLITITRGRSSEGSQVDRSTARMSINNRDGRFSPRNPTGPYYGTLTRNTQLRVSVNHGHTRSLTTAAGDGWTAPDSAGLSITGDIDLRAEMYADSWQQSLDPIGKWTTVGSQRSYGIDTLATGYLRIFWSTDGTAEFTAESTVALPVHGRRAVRATLDVNNGAAGRTATFYTAPTLAGPWTQLGEPVVQAGTTSIFNSTAVAYLGLNCVDAEVYGAEIRDGIAGTVRADPDFTAVAEGANSFSDGINTWSALGSPEVTTRRYRFWGEVSEWPAKWDATGTDVWTPIEASGILRRIGQSDAPLKSTMFRALTTLDPLPVAYWPGEDVAGSTVVASGMPGHPPAVFTFGLATFANFGEYAASAPLLTSNNSSFKGRVPAYTGTGEFQTRWLMAVPAAGSTNGAILPRIITTGSVARWDVVYGTGGTLALKAYDRTGTEVLDTGALGYVVNGKLLRVSVELSQDGSDVDYNLLTLEVGETTGLSSAGTVSSQTLGIAKEVHVGDGASNDVAVGHISVQKEITSLYDLNEELAAFVSEFAGRRIERLCAEEGIGFVGIGDLDLTTTMGAQGQNSVLALLREAGEADLGILYEPRGSFGLAYRTRVSLNNQEAALALDYAQAHLSSIEPTDDDQNLRNDVTATRPSGSSARYVKETGTLSVLPPPDGVGRYDGSASVNVAMDSQLPHQASYRVHLGTVDEGRYPVLGVDLSRTVYSTDVPLANEVVTLDVGDRLAVENPPAWLPPDDITQLAQGFTETLGNFEYEIAVNCSPESPHHIAAYDQGSRYSSLGSTLAEDLTTTETAADVATVTGGLLWTTDAGQMPFDIRVGGEVMTVTAITGASSPQTFTVTRSVNGVVKTHSTGAIVALNQPAIYAL